MNAAMLDSCVVAGADALLRASAVGSVLFLLTWTAARLLRHADPALRGWLWRLFYVELVVLLALPAPIRPSLPVLRQLQVGLAATLPAPGSPQPAPREGHVWETGQPSPRASSEPSPARVTPPTRWTWRHAVVAGWMLGVGIGLVRLVRHLRASRRLRREALPPDERLLAAERLARGDAAAVPVARHAGLTQPLVLGLRNPIILVPVRVATACSTEELVRILRHERAHVTRRDLPWMLLRRAVGAVLFFHPLLAWAEREAGLADEMACDAHASAPPYGGSAAYAATLIRVLELGGPGATSGSPALGAALGPAARGLRQRILALYPHPRTPRWRRAGAALLAILAFASAWPAWQTHTALRQYDPDLNILDFHVSRGAHHALRIHREHLRLGPLALTESRASTGYVDSPGRLRLPERLSAVLDALGLPAPFQGRNCSVSFSHGADGHAFFVRFAAPDEQAEDLCREVTAELVDDQGEAIPLRTRDDGIAWDGNRLGGERLRVWTLEPAPLVAGTFSLRLSRPGLPHPVAVLRLGTLGGPAPRHPTS